MTNSEIIKMLKFTDGSLVALKEIALDERAPSEIRRTAFLAISKKFKKSPMQSASPEVEVNNVKIKTNRQIE